MPFAGQFIAILDGHLIYGWGQHRYFFTQRYGQAASKPRWMEDFGIDVKSTNAFGQALTAGHQKYRQVVDKGRPPAWTDADSAQKCKGGLWWATRSHKHVHMYLGGLDLDMVVGSGQAKSKGITCRELRWIYRFRADAEVQAYVQFWRPIGVGTLDGLQNAQPGCNAEQCGPPWDDTVFTDGSTKFGNYVPRGNHDINGVHI